MLSFGQRGHAAVFLFITNITTVFLLISYCA